MNEPFYQTMEQAVEDAYLSIPVHVLDLSLDIAWEA